MLRNIGANMRNCRTSSAHAYNGPTSFCYSTCIHGRPV